MKPRLRTPYLEHLIRDLPRCRICNQRLIVTCDRSQPSKPTEFLGTSWLKTKPQFMRMYPSLPAEEQSDLCWYHQTQEAAKPQ